MDFMKCPKCGGLLIFEVAQIVPHNITADGEHFVRDSTFSYSCRVEEYLICKHCGMQFCEGKTWMRDEQGRIRLT